MSLRVVARLRLVAHVLRQGATFRDDGDLGGTGCRDRLRSHPGSDEEFRTVLTMPPVYQAGVSQRRRTGPSRPRPVSGGRTRTSIARDLVDAGDVRAGGSSRSASRKRSWVAHAGSSTSTTRRPSSSDDRAGRGRRPAARPASSQRANTPADGLRALGAAAATARRASTLSRERPAARRRPAGSTGVMPRSLPASTPQRPASGVGAAAGSGPAVVSTHLAGGQVAQQRRAPVGVELGEHVVEQRAPAAIADALGDQPVGGEAQRQGQRPLLALRGVGPRRQAVERQVELVAVRARPGDTWRRTSSARAAASAAARPACAPRRLVARARPRPASPASSS